MIEDRQMSDTAGMYALGLELSTQSAKSLVLDIESGRVEHLCSHEYDTCFPEYQTQGGVLVSSDEEVRHTSPFMLIQALNLVFRHWQREGLDLGRVRAIKLDGMQHCTVYANQGLAETLSKLDPGHELLPQLRQTISRQTSPIWEDRSPAREAAYMTESLLEQGGIEGLTGNRAELRFPAAQILKWGREHPEELENTAHIFLLSAFMTSILSGRITAVDTGDGWGTNLNHTDIQNPGWSSPVLSAMHRYLQDASIRTDLSGKIGAMDHYDAPAGRIHSYFSEKYGLHRETIILTGTGDNPATLLGCGSETVISLGSSFTVNGMSKGATPSPKGEYNIFGYIPGRVMALSVFSNGSKVHDHFLRRYLLDNTDREITDKDWKHYVQVAGAFHLNEDDPLMLPYRQAESVPLRSKGIVRQGFDEADASINIRALCISQILSLRLHSSHLSDPDSICVVGGAARNPFLMQLIADVFQAKAYNIRNADFAAPLGCAVSGARQLLKLSYEDAARRYVQRDESSVRFPRPDAPATVRHLLDRYAQLEATATG
jgi:xylulokinase